MHQNIRYFIRSKVVVLNFITVRNSLHKRRKRYCAINNNLKIIKKLLSIGKHNDVKGTQFLFVNITFH